MLRVLTWNLYHGRAVPPARRDLLGEFCAALAGWEWDVALLQEVPPWWPQALAAATGAHPRFVLTSRNCGLVLRHAVAVRRPDLIKSNGGGADAILVRAAAGPVTEHRSVRLAAWPERRRLHAVRLASGVWVGNVHLSTRADAARVEAADARAAMLGWAGDAPLVLGGDFNVCGLSLHGFVTPAAREIDYVFAHGLAPAAAGEALDSGPLSDHAPLLASVRAL